MNANFNEIEFSADDVVNIDDWIPHGDYNPHNVRPWLLHDQGFVIAVVFADSLQDALDEAVDAGKMDRYLIDGEANLSDYEDEDEDGISYLGNAGEPFDIESLGVIELPNPPYSMEQLFVDVIAKAEKKTFHLRTGLN